MLNFKDKFLISAAKHYFKAFVGLMHSDYIFAKHNRIICEKLQELSEGKINRLIINCPPRAGKSLLSSQLFPAWFLGNNPHKDVICATYGQSLADQFGRKVRNMLRDPCYRYIFPNAVLSEDSSSIKSFSLTEGGSYFACGAGSSITGKGADALIIDDTLKNRQEANSEVITQNIIDWFKSTAFTRLSPTGRVLILATRWSEKDLCGYLLEKEPEVWQVINIPAISDEGKSYWPDRWPINKLQDIKKTLGTYEFEALYQQRPSPIGGGMFKKEWFEICRAPAANLKKVRYWDRAATIPKNGSDPDYTVGIKMGKDNNENFFVLDMVRLRGSPLDVETAILNTAIQDGYETEVVLEQDPGQAGIVEVNYLIRKLSGFNVRANKVSTDKVTRANPFAAQCEAGNVKLHKSFWNDDFLNELSMFPYGRHDDIVDAASGAFNQLSKNKSIYEKLIAL